MFALHPQLAADTFCLGNFPLSQALLMDDASYPWLILVPRRDGLREIFDLNPEDQQQLLWESCHLAEVLCRHFQADKMNIAALGNMVPQLHIHHIVRYRSDAAWPKPVWGVQTAVSYQPDQRAALCRALIPQFQQFESCIKF
ncbi:MAG: HIT domain-containing protein [Deltaproteobacteria bacterium]|jgi:diadenosine tetraphosphate (Ap4A) HIT family hydrolase|nr:HIT domain-containing protein [Deltaproteobacteria bacterium]